MPANTIEAVNVPTTVAPASILVVDDDRQVLELLAAYLGQTAHTIHTAHNAPAARRVLGEQAVDLVITDIKLPGFFGLDILQWPEFQANRPDCICITGYATTELAITAIKQGVFDFLRKPFELPDVLASVSRCLERRQLQSDNARLLASLQSLNTELETTVGERTRELSEAYEALVTANRRVARLDDLKQQFIAIVSHEFNTPLNVIKGYLALFLGGVFGNLAGEQADALETLEREVDRVVELVGEFLKIYALEGEAEVFQREAIGPRQLALEVVDTIGPFLSQRHQQFILNIPDDLSPVCANWRQLSIVLTNLLVNAIRFTPDNGLITLSAQPSVQGEQFGVLFCVRDTGVGIPADQIARIFEGFYDLRDVNKHTTGRVEFGASGLGLGLTITRRIVEQHDGRIWVESAPDEGSRFYVFIPSVEGGDETSGGEPGMQRVSKSTVMLPVSPKQPHPPV